MISRNIAMTMIGSKYLLERDMLSACVTRINNQFYPPSVLNEARYHAEQIQKLVSYMEEMTTKKKDEVVSYDELKKRIQ